MLQKPLGGEHRLEGMDVVAAELASGKRKAAMAVGVMVLWFALAAMAFAIQAPAVPSPVQAPANPANPDNKADNGDEGKDITVDKQPKVNREGTTDDRIFGMLPNYTTVENAKRLPPLSSEEKFALAADGTFDRVEFAFVGVLAGVNQLDHENPSWGSSWGGYARRYGETFANQGVENFMVSAILPSMLGEDPRYYDMAKGSYMRRFLYSASRIVVTRDDSGVNGFNYSEVAGSFAAAGISNLYEPTESRTVGNTMEVWATQVAIDTFSNELREFWPDIKHKVFRRPLPH